MDSIEKIGKIEFAALVTLIIFNNLILNIPSIIINLTGTGSWINVIYITVLAVLFILIICKLLKPFPGNDILDVAEFCGGKFLKNIIAILYLIMFISFTAFSLRFFTNSLRLIYFDATPLVILILFFLVPALFISKLGFKAISSVNLLVFSFSTVTFFVYFFAASGFFVWQRLFPILGYGTKVTFVNNILNLFSFNIVAYLYFLKPFIKKENDYKKMFIFGIILFGIYLLLGILALIMTFSFIAQTNETLSVFIVTRLISFGNFFQRVDALITFIWILVILSFLTFNVFIISYIIRKTLKLESTSGINYSVAALIFATSLAFKDISIIKTITKDIYRPFSFILMFVISFIIFLLAYIKKKNTKGVSK